VSKFIFVYSAANPFAHSINHINYLILSIISLDGMRGSVQTVGLFVLGLGLTNSDAAVIHSVFKNGHGKPGEKGRHHHHASKAADEDQELSVGRNRDVQVGSIQEDAASSVDEMTNRRFAEERKQLGPRDVPGVKASPRFATKVIHDQWSTTLMTFYAESKAAAENVSECNGYFSHLDHWTNSWVNFEFKEDDSGQYEPVMLEVSRLYGGKAIRSAKITPERGDVTVQVKNGKAYVTMLQPCQIVLDINGRMETTDTGPSYKGDAIHTYSILGNPTLKNKPDPSSKDVYVVKPGVLPPSDFNQSTLYFAPGVHRILKEEDINTKAYFLQPGKAYYFPPDTWVHGALNTTNDTNADITIFGYGHLVGSSIPRGDCKTNPSPEALHMRNVVNADISGITFVDFPNHHLILGGDEEDDTHSNILRNIKVMGWRANGDGVHVCNYWTVQDLFLRTQDDSLYIASCSQGQLFDRIVTWNDANGASFIFTAGHGGMNAVLRNSDAIYARSSWAFWAGGRVFNLRGIEEDQTITNITIENVRASDSLPTMPFLDFNARSSETHVLLQAMQAIPSLMERKWSGQSDQIDASLGLTSRQVKNFQEYVLYNDNKFKKFATVGKFTDVTFSHVTVRNFSSVQYDLDGHSLPHGLLNVMNTTDVAAISNVAFNDVTFAGTSLADLVCDETVFFISEEVKNLTIDGKDIADMGHHGGSLKRIKPTIIAWHDLADRLKRSANWLKGTIDS